jgi:hypothetical protein
LTQTCCSLRWKARLSSPIVSPLGYQKGIWRVHSASKAARRRFIPSSYITSEWLSPMTMSSTKGAQIEGWRPSTRDPQLGHKACMSYIQQKSQYFSNGLAFMLQCQGWQCVSYHDVATVTDFDKWQKTSYRFVDGHGIGHELSKTCAPSLRGVRAVEKKRKIPVNGKESQWHPSPPPPNDPLANPAGSQLELSLVRHHFTRSCSAFS